MKVHQMSNINYSESNIFDVVSKLMDILSNFVDFTIFNAPVLLRITRSEIGDHDHYLAQASPHLPIVLCGYDCSVQVRHAAHPP